MLNTVNFLKSLLGPRPAIRAQTIELYVVPCDFKSVHVPGGDIEIVVTVHIFDPLALCADNVMMQFRVGIEPLLALVDR